MMRPACAQARCRSRSTLAPSRSAAPTSQGPPGTIFTNTLCLHSLFLLLLPLCGPRCKLKRRGMQLLSRLPELQELDLQVCVVVVRGEGDAEHTWPEQQRRRYNNSYNSGVSWPKGCTT